MKRKYDVVVVGGGIVGLLTAYRLSKEKQSVLVVEKSSIGNKLAASSGFTRSLRNDYQDPRYSILARESWGMWKELEQELGTSLVVVTGCLNICDDSLTQEPYARQSMSWLKRDGNSYLEFTGPTEFAKKYSQFNDIDYAVLDEEAGMCLANKALLKIRDELMKKSEVTILEHTEISEVSTSQEGVFVELSDEGKVSGGTLVVAAGLGTAGVMDKIDSSQLKFTLNPDRPIECLYYYPSDQTRYTSDVFPIFANLDTGVYGHPMVPGVTDAVKIGMYAPPEIVKGTAPDSMYGVKEFVRHYLPDLAESSKVSRVTDTDQCSYDMTDDGDFIIGRLPDAENVIVATGFNGTGFKFAPATASIVCGLVNQETQKADISAFDPARFNLKKGRK